MHNRANKKRIALSVLVLLVGLFVAACQVPGTQTANTEPAAEPTEAPVVEETAADESATEDSAAEDSIAEEPKAEPTENPVEEAEITGEPQTFTIVQEGTEARFRINEVLRGSDFEVVGVTSLVTGEISINPADLAQTEIGPIQIDARDFTTDTRRRNVALRRFILRSAADETRYITFVPTAIDGLPASATAGETIDFQVTGDLTIRETTRPVTFDMSVTATSDSEISGTGSTTVLYADYGISIPSVPFIASVEDEVILELDFTAAAE